jgi:signal peptidase I
MRSPSPAKKLAAGAIALAVCASAWLFLAPPTLGGSTTYVFTDGTSMQPHFHTGDLVLVRPRITYRLGDIVAYHSHMLGTIVLHRIIGRDGPRYLFKGDNNNFVDPEHPARDQLIGALWLHVPGAAKRFGPLRKPATIALLVELGVLLLGGGAFTQQRRRRRRRADPGEGRPPSRRRVRTGEWVGGLVTLGSGVLLPLVALAVVAYNRPATTLVPATVPYKQTGSFSYSAGAVWGAAYPHGRLATGDPVFLRLVHTVDVRLAYRFQSAAQHSVEGTASLDARIEASNGWRTTIQLQRPRRFAGDGAVLAGTLGVRSLPALLRRLETSTDVSGSYTLTIVPHIRVQGTVAGVPLNVPFAPAPLSFTLNAGELQPPPVGTKSPFSRSTPGTVPVSKPRPATLSFKVAHLSVAKARVISERGIAAALCALFGCALAFLLAPVRREDEPTGIQHRYGRWLIPVARVLQPAERQLVEVAGMEALVKIAERYDRMILHEANDRSDVFSVADDGVLYRYVVVAEREVEPEPAHEAPAALTAVPPLKRSA